MTDDTKSLTKHGPEFYMWEDEDGTWNITSVWDDGAPEPANTTFGHGTSPLEAIQSAIENGKKS